MIELGLSRVFRLLARVPLPWRAIHVAGTNGKGSICAYITGMLSAYNVSGHRNDTGLPTIKHGRFNSPHLIDRWDCITIDGATISESIFNQVEARVVARNEAEDIQATEFEVLTATAFEIFTIEKVDVAVIEVGMGGRLDATNILGRHSEWDCFQSSESTVDFTYFRPKPLATAIATIALDHQGFLGTTLEEISTEKAGIMKKGVPVVLAPNSDSVNRNIIRIANEVGVGQIIRAEDTQGYEDIWRHSSTETGFDNDQVRKQNSAMAFSLTWLALQRLDRLKARDPTLLVPLISSLHAVPANTIWPGRVQDISIEPITGYQPSVLLDGAHNAESAEALANTVCKRLATEQRPVTWVIAASQGKDISSMLRHFLSVPLRHKRRYPSNIIATKFGPVDGMPWVKAMSPVEIVDQARKVADELDKKEAGPRLTIYSATPDLKDALRDACDSARDNNGFIVVAGSLYLVGDLLRMLREHRGLIG